MQEPLPFELVVLEAALKEVVASLSLQIKELEGVALPALDALTRSVTPANLERVRKVKTRHQRLTLRTEALKEELQRFMQDDEDMSEMCLTRRKELEEAARAALMSGEQSVGTPSAAVAGVGGAAGGGIGIAAPPQSSQQQQQQLFQQQRQQQQQQQIPPMQLYHHQQQSPFVPSSSFTRRGGLALARFHQTAFTAGGIGGGGGSPPGAAGRGPSSALPSRDVLLSMGGGGQAAVAAAAAAAEEEADADAQQDVENLLESYYMQVDGLVDKLVSVGEYIKDTEEYINIELDSSRNRLIRFEVILTVATFAIMPFNLVAGILGENLIIPEQITGSVSQFYGVNLIAGAVCFMVFYMATLYMRMKKLL